MLPGGSPAPPARYRGRFAPSPTGPLHAGSLVAALASWLDARAHGGTWLVRMEDVDTPRCVPGCDQLILAQLATFGLHPDEPVLWQSKRSDAYQQALDQLFASGLAYPCGCTRREIEAALAARGTPRQRHAELVYPGTCRTGLHGRKAGPWRLRTDILMSKPTLASVNRSFTAPDSGVIQSLGEDIQKRKLSLVQWTDRRLGTQAQDVETEVGDFVLLRADRLWAYQLAVLVDDAAQGITHVVRGEDLADNTPRQILLQCALGLPTPAYLHMPLVLGSNGEKLSKLNGAEALDTAQPLAALKQAGAALGLAPAAATVGDWLAAAVLHWRREWCGY